MSRINKPTIAYLGKVIGAIIYSMSTVILGPLFYRYFENGKVISFRLNKGNFDAPAKISPEGKQELQGWPENTDSIKKTYCIALN